MLCGKPAVVIAHRKGERDLLLFTWNEEKHAFQSEVLDHVLPAAAFPFDGIFDFKIDEIKKICHR